MGSRSGREGVRQVADGFEAEKEADAGFVGEEGCDAHLGVVRGHGNYLGFGGRGCCLAKGR